MLKIPSDEVKRVHPTASKIMRSSTQLVENGRSIISHSLADISQSTKKIKPKLQKSALPLIVSLTDGREQTLLELGNFDLFAKPVVLPFKEEATLVRDLVTLRQSVAQGVEKKYQQLFGKNVQEMMELMTPSQERALTRSPVRGSGSFSFQGQASLKLSPIVSGVSYFG